MSYEIILEVSKSLFYVLLLHIAFTITVYYMHTIQGEMIISIFVDSIHHVVFFNRTLSACCRTEYVCSSFALFCWKVVSYYTCVSGCACVANVLTTSPQSSQWYFCSYFHASKCAHYSCGDTLNVAANTICIAQNHNHLWSICSEPSAAVVGQPPTQHGKSSAVVQ